MPVPICNLIVVCGPTASGKTRLAVELARNLGGEIISADSRQVYRGMDIGTGKDLVEYGRTPNVIPYHCIDIADPCEVYTVHRYQKDCFAAIHEIWSRKKMPVICGGTGLYIESVLKGYRITAVPENQELRDSLSSESCEALDARLLAASPALYGSTDKSSKKRIVRALEVAAGSDASEEDFRAEPPEELHPIVLCARWPRAELCARIDCRLEQRLEQGLVDEVKKLLESGLPGRRFSMFGMEYRQVARYLDKQVPYEKMIADLKIEIHRLAKRQMTWFRGMERRGIKIHWVDRADFVAALEALNVANVSR
jgi:tRNA dimethylallyltransferase